MEPTNFFEGRVPELAVADVLRVVASMPNRRSQRRDGDLHGQFDFWFDGGAARINTGFMVLVLADGTQVHVCGPISWLSLSIEFPDGRRVSVEQAQQ